MNTYIQTLKNHAKMFPRSSGRFPPISEGTQLHTHSLPFRSTLAAATKPRNQPSSVSSALGCQSSVTRRWGGRAATIIMRQAERERERASREKLRKQTSSGHECRFICDREREERGRDAMILALKEGSKKRENRFRFMWINCWTPGREEAEGFEDDG